MNSSERISYKDAIELSKIGYMRDVDAWYTHGVPTLVDGLIMYEKVAPAYNMTEPMVNAIYVPAPTIENAIRFLDIFYNDPYAISLSKSLRITKP